jgi:ferric-dicitrate binding protein FerR (iron transport regulator)
MYQDQFWSLLAKKLSGEASAEELAELSRLLKENPHLSYAAQNLTDLWKLPPREDKEAAEAAFQSHLALTAPSATPVQENFDEPARGDNSKRKRWRRALVPLVVLVPALLIFLAIGNNKQVTTAADSRLQEVVTQPGTRTRLVLPDSSTVWLNAGSKLTYQQPFGATERLVTLSGEAYFDVVKKEQPFIIQTGGARIKVLGTSFNVRSYPAEEKIETSLVHGRVEVSLADNPENKFYLQPNQKLTLNLKETTRSTKQKAQQTPLAVVSELNYLDDATIAETSWVENKLAFEDESFEEVAKKMERWYGVTIRFQNQAVREERLTGLFEKETVEQALTALQEIARFHFTKKENQIIITH